MSFIVWYYTKGIIFYLKKWFYTLSSVNHFFSTLLLLKTLFAPWKRLVIIDKRPGFDIGRFFESFSYNLVSRGIGAVVRLSLFFVSLILLSLCLIFGILGFFVWILFPPLGIPVYINYKKRPDEYVKKIKSIESLLKTEGGNFLLSHTGLIADDLLNKADRNKINGTIFDVDSFEQLISNLVKADVWTDDFLRSKNLAKQDLVWAAYWWDKKCRYVSGVDAENNFSRPGIGLELLFGYTPTLNRYSADMSAPVEFSHHLVGRLPIVSRISDELMVGKSVVLVGQPGVGKRTIILEFAHRVAAGKFGQKMSYKRVVEFDYNLLLSETGDLNLKKAKLGEVLDESSAAGNIILVIHDIQRLTNIDVEGFDFTDILESHLEKGNLKIIAVSTVTDYERFIFPNLKLMKYFGRVEATPPDAADAAKILIDVADRFERTKKILITTPVISRILEASERYITDTPFPEKAIELLDALLIYKEGHGGVIASAADVDVVLSEKTGITFNDLTDQRKIQLTNLEEVIHERLIGQDAAVNLIAKSLRTKTLNIGAQKKPLGSFLFMGPTGVGKTETAKVLAKVYFGSEKNMLRFNMNEYSEKEGIERLVGSAVRREPGDLTTQIKNHPASLLLLDEIEKAPREVINIFLALLDEGEITDAMGRKVVCRNLFVVATSNAGTEYIRQLLANGVDPTDLQKLTLDNVLKQRIFSPEFINRFDGVIVYMSLNEIQLKQVVRLKLNEFALNLREKSIHLTITDDLVNKVAKDGYSAEFGARPVERIINLMIGDVISQAILKNEISAGDTITIIPDDSESKYKILKSSS